MTIVVRSAVAQALLILMLNVFATGVALVTITPAHADPYHACGGRAPTSANDTCYQSWSAGGEWAVTVLRQRPSGTYPQLTADQALQLCRNGITAANPVAPLAFQTACLEVLNQYVR